jgi:DNA-binding transcriptional regulator YiaG
MTPRQIIQLRKTLGLTQQQLADLIAANRPTVARWEAGKHQPRGGYLKVLQELQKKAAEVRIRAERKADQLLKGNKAKKKTK